MRNRLQNGLAYSAVEYLEALRWRGPALAAHLDAVGDVDVVIAPASGSVAPTIVATDLGGMPEAEAAIQAITRFMRPTNFLGLRGNRNLDCRSGCSSLAVPLVTKR